MRIIISSIISYFKKLLIPPSDESKQVPKTKATLPSPVYDNQLMSRNLSIM